ncbi:hypothetical protein [Flavivirga rizhaonensis]|uniref:Uncharacterized protein n=1 Tax=Flavivirga rizhaonensis TaxID=2559571 RepID=A0A4S1DSE2_9FLAO|nr:hypothetical protein [Flavivirga rizhaonensis]TGV00645.1 hypothetical protein EM932_18715 [Flavivirga rizhaonensis]
MDLESRKYKIVEKLMKVCDEETLYKIEQVINKDKGQHNSISELPEPIQRLLSQSIKDSEKGRVSLHEEVMANIRAKYNLQ